MYFVQSKERVTAGLNCELLAWLRAETNTNSMSPKLELIRRILLGSTLSRSHVTVAAHPNNTYNNVPKNSQRTLFQKWRSCISPFTLAKYSFSFISLQRKTSSEKTQINALFSVVQKIPAECMRCPR